MSGQAADHPREHMNTELVDIDAIDGQRTNIWAVRKTNGNVVLLAEYVVTESGVIEAREIDGTAYTIRGYEEVWQPTIEGLKLLIDVIPARQQRLVRDDYK